MEDEERKHDGNDEQWCSKCGFVMILLPFSDVCPVCGNHLIWRRVDSYRWDNEDQNVILNELQPLDQYDPVLFKKREEYIKNMEEEYERKAKREPRYVSRCVPKCPTCGSTNVTKISGLERTASVLTLGILSRKINKSYKCNSCHCTW